MIDKTSALTRHGLVESRCLAMRGDAAGGLSSLDDRLKDDALPILDRIALYMAKAEILHLDCKDTDALAVMDTCVEPLLTSMPDEIAVIAGYNRSDISFALLQAHDQMAIADLREHLAMQLWGHETLLQASSAADDGKHYQALPSVWRELHRTYLQGCWRPFHFASDHMAIECLKLGLVSDAAYNAIVAGHKDTCKKVGQQLSRHLDASAIDTAVRKVLEISHLQLHFCSGAHILRTACDVIPDELIGDVFTWAMQRAVIQPKEYSERGILTTAWETLAGIAQRLNASQAGLLIDAAIAHPAWSAVPEQPRQVILYRQEMLLALRKVCRTVDEATLERLADATLPLARERKQDYDYAQALNIFCEIVQRCGERLKTKVTQSLYPSGERLTTYLLMLAPHFGKEINKSDSLSKDADMVARNVRLQVQRVKIGTEPEPVNGVLYTQHCDLKEVRHIVSVTGSDDVSAILGQRDVLPRKAIEKVCLAALDMIAESENAIANRAHLAEAIRDVREHCTGRIKTRAWEVLSQVATGEIAEPSLFMSAADAANPLNPYKMSSGPPAALQAHALYTLAVLESCQPGLWGKKFEPIVCAAIRNENPEVRIAGCRAARELSSMSKVLRRSILFATRDGDPRVIDAAFHVLADKTDRDAEADEWETISAICDQGAVSRETVVRRATAYAVPRLIKTCSLPAIRRQLEGTREKLGCDVSWSVRYLAAEKDSADVAIVAKLRELRARKKRAKKRDLRR